MPYRKRKVKDYLHVLRTYLILLVSACSGLRRSLSGWRGCSTGATRLCCILSIAFCVAKPRNGGTKKVMALRSRQSCQWLLPPTRFQGREYKEESIDYTSIVAVTE